MVTYLFSKIHWFNWEEAISYNMLHCIWDKFVTYNILWKKGIGNIFSLVWIEYICLITEAIVVWIEYIHLIREAHCFFTQSWILSTPKACNRYDVRDLNDVRVHLFLGNSWEHGGEWHTDCKMHKSLCINRTNHLEVALGQDYFPLFVKWVDGWPDAAKGADVGFSKWAVTQAACCWHYDRSLCRVTHSRPPDIAPSFPVYTGQQMIGPGPCKTNIFNSSGSMEA